MKFFWRICLGALFSLSLAACDQAKQTESTGQPSPSPSNSAVPSSTASPAVHVITSFSLLGDMVSAVGGERVQIDSLVGINQDAHVYQPSPQDVQKLGRAQVFVVNGLGYESWLERLEKNSGFAGVKVIATQDLPALKAPQHGEDEHDHEHDHASGGLDPHAWQDPALVAKYYVPNMVKGLSKADPAGATYYQQHGQAYINQLNQLSIQIEQILGRFPREQRKVVGFPCRAGFNDEADSCAQAFGDQVLVYGRGGEQGRDGDVFLIQFAVGDNEQPAAAMYSIFRFGA